MFCDHQGEQSFCICCQQLICELCICCTNSKKINVPKIHLNALCSRCDQTQAQIKCEQCMFQFCQECFQSVHKIGKFSTHIKIEINQDLHQQIIKQMSIIAELEQYCQEQMTSILQYFDQIQVVLDRKKNSFLMVYQIIVINKQNSLNREQIQLKQLSKLIQNNLLKSQSVQFIKKKDIQVQFEKPGLVLGTNPLYFGIWSWEIKLKIIGIIEDLTASLVIGVANKQRKIVGTTLNYGYQRDSLIIKVLVDMDNKLMTITSKMQQMEKDSIKV